MLLDLAIAWDPLRRRCDLLVDGSGVVLDTTPVTPMLISLGSDQRAEPDDALPDTVTEGSIANSFNPRRGWIGDAINAATSGGRAGSRLWLLEREKHTDDVLRRAQDYAETALAWLGDREQVDIAVDASWPGRNALLLDVSVGAARQQLQVAL